jgi:acetyltransferase-like isoleucine patch superfamily enzyme
MTQSRPRRALNRVLYQISKVVPGATSIRPFIHKLRGVKISGKVFIGEEVFLENNYPDRIELGDQTQIALRTTIVAHFRGPGRVIIQPKVFIATGCLITAASGQTLTIGEGAFLAAGSVVTRDVPPYTMVSGSPAKPIAKLAGPMLMQTSYEEFKRNIRPLNWQPTTKPAE